MNINDLYKIYNDIYKSYINYKYNSRMHSSNRRHIEVISIKVIRISKVKTVRELSIITFTNNCRPITSWTVFQTDLVQFKIPIITMYKRRINRIFDKQMDSNSLHVLRMFSSALLKIILSTLSKKLNKDWLKLLILDMSSLRKALSSPFTNRKVWTFLENLSKERAEVLIQG